MNTFVRMNNRVKGHVLLFTVAAIGGMHYSIIKLVMPEFLDPNTIIILRDVIAFIFFGLIYLLFVREKIEKKDIPGMLFCAACGASANQLLFFGGLNLTSPINASLMMIGSPMFVILFSIISAKEKISIYKILGIFLSALGVILLILHSSSKGVGQFYLGDLMVLLNAILWGAFIVFVKPYVTKYHILTVMSFLFFWGSLFVLPFCYESLVNTNWEVMSPTAWWALAFIIVVATLIQYFLNVYVLKFVDSSLAGSYTYLQPVIATIFAVSMGKDFITFEKIGLMGLIMLGIYLVSLKKIENKKT